MDKGPVNPVAVVAWVVRLNPHIHAESRENHAIVAVRGAARSDVITMTGATKI